MGQRLTHTFRKLPNASPSNPAKIVAKMRIMRELEYKASDAASLQCRESKNPPNFAPPAPCLRFCAG
jgi:hypothetical protein